MAPSIIREACATLQIGEVIEREALLYLQCVLETKSPAFRCRVQNQAPLAATSLYLAIRMHQLPVSVQRLVLAVGQKACFSVKLFWKVAQAVHRAPPAVDYTTFAVQVMADVVNVRATLKIQVYPICLVVSILGMLMMARVPFARCSLSNFI